MKKAEEAPNGLGLEKFIGAVLQENLRYTEG